MNGSSLGGSVLGPLLFLVHVNDIHKSSKEFTFYLFEDDISLTYTNNGLHSINYVEFKLITFEKTDPCKQILIPLMNIILSLLTNDTVCLKGTNMQ